MINYEILKDTVNRNFTASGVLMPLHWLTLMREIRSLAEIKVIGVVYGYDGIVGVESSPPTFSDLVQRTGLSKPSVSQGIKSAIERGEIAAVEDGESKYFLPTSVSENGLGRGKENSLPHEHDHESLNLNNVLNFTSSKDHDHVVETLPRKHLYQTLLTEFGFTTSQRVAADICLTPKYPLDVLYAQIRYTRYETQHGQDGDPAKILRNPAGRLVFRLKRNAPAPSGFVLIDALEAEGWTYTQIYAAIRDGEVELPAIKDTIGYRSWVHHGA